MPQKFAIFMALKLSFDRNIDRIRIDSTKMEYVSYVGNLALKEDKYSI